jgi:hypothetical protein
MFGLFRRGERLGTRESLGQLVQQFSQQSTNAYCTRCGLFVPAVRPRTSRARNILLTVVTGGIWAIAWLVEAYRYPGWRCPDCHDPVH